MTLVWHREGKQPVALVPTADADNFIRRTKSKSEGNNGVSKTLDKYTVTV